MKLYYDDKRHRNAFKTQKTIMKRDSYDRKASFLVRKITYTVDEVIEEKLIEESIRSKDGFEAIAISNNINQNNNVNKDNDIDNEKNNYHDKTSERKLNSKINLK